MDLAPQECSVPKCFRETEQLPWKWILEKILQNKEINFRVAQGITNYIPDLADQRCSGLQERLALRYMEELVETEPINARIIPLVKALVMDDTNQIELLLWVQTEATLHFLRGCEEKQEKDWIGFANAIDFVFHEENVEIQLARRSELSAFLKDENREEHCNTWFQKYPLEMLRKNLLQFIEDQKATIRSSFLDKLVQDVCSGYCSFAFAPKAVHFDPEHGEVQSVQVYQLDLSLRKTKAVDGELKATLPSPIGGIDDETGLITLQRTCKGEATEDDHRAIGLVPDVNGCYVKPRDTPGDLSEERSLACRLMILRNQKRKTKFSSHQRSQSLLIDKNFTKVKGIEPIQTGKYFSALGAESYRNVITSSDSGQENINEGFIPETQATKGAECCILENGHGEICCKCKRQGKLLNCRGCRLAVHITCAEGSIGKIGADIEWYCPICSYKAARIAYRKSKKAATSATKLKCTFVDAITSFSDCHMDSGAHDGNVRKDIGSGGKSVSYCTDLPLNRIVEKSIPDLCCDKVSNGLGNPSRIDSEGRFPSLLHSMKSASPEIEIHSSHWPGDLLQEQDRDEHDTIERNHCDISFVSHASPYEFDVSEPALEENQTNRTNKRGRQNIPGLRRKNLPWTKLEEEVLKEGLKHYSNGEGSWGFQWARILEYGYGKFHESRTSNDLKDKWRNLTKSFSMGTDELEGP